MTAYKIENPFEFFSDGAGNALDGGKIYIGTAGLDAEANPIAVYLDAAETTPATQPILTTAGYPTDGGGAVDIYTADVYSITVRDENDALVYSELNASNDAPALLSLPIYFNTVSDLLADTTSITSYRSRYGSSGYKYVLIKNGGFRYTLDLSQVDDTDVSTAGGVNLAVQPSASGWDPLSFGAAGDGVNDDTAAINAAFDRARSTGVHATVAFSDNGVNRYRVTGQIDIDRVSITAPLGRVELFSDGITDDHMMKVDAIIDGVATSFGDAKITIENLIFDCMDECGAINLGVRHHTVKNCIFLNFNGTLTSTAIYAERNTQKIEGNWFLGSDAAAGSRGGIAIYLDGQTNATVAASMIVGNHIADCARGVLINEALMLLVDRNVIQSCDNGELVIENTLTNRDIDGVTISNNYFENQEAGHEQFIHINPNSDNDIESVNIISNTFYGGNETGQVAIRVEAGEIMTINGNFFRAVPYCLAVTANSAETSGTFEGNTLSTNVNGFVDPADAQSLAAARKFRFGKNKAWNVKDTFKKTIPQFATSLTFNHGLDIEPEAFHLNLGDTTAAVAAEGQLYIDAVTDTTITVSFSTTNSYNVAFFCTAWFGEL